MLHFHETESGIVYDLKCVVTQPGFFDRFEAGHEADWRKLLAETRRRCRQLQKKPAA